MSHCRTAGTKSAEKSGNKSEPCPLQITKGYEFESETDTEVIPKLIKYVYDNRESESVTFSTLVEQVIQQLVSRSLTATRRNKPNLFTAEDFSYSSDVDKAFLCNSVIIPALTFPVQRFKSPSTGCFQYHQALFSSVCVCVH